MRQRSAIARAFVTDPGMLLMDEPFAALDAQNRVILQAELVRLWEQTGKTVIYVTHSIEEALLMGDRTVIMTAQPGRIKQIIDVPFPHPRDLIQLSASAEFGRLKLDIWRVLEEEVTRARGPRSSNERHHRARRKERLLYLASPIGLLAAVAVAADGGPRRPPLHSDAERHRGPLLADGGERRARPAHRRDALSRVRRLLHRQHSRHRGRPVDGDVPAGPHFRRSADRGAVSDPEDRADAAAAAGVRLRRCVQDRAGGDRGVLPGDHQHLFGRRQYRENLLGRRAGISARASR